MELIKTIDLWTEQYENQYECFNGAFVDGFEKERIPFDKYKILKNCNCIITNSNGLNIRNKQNAIVFYKDSKPVRLIVINKDTNIDVCINNALKQYFNGIILKELYDKNNITFSIIDLGETPIINSVQTPELDVGSCDRWNLLYNMLKGSYTESDTTYGNFSDDKYIFIPNIYLTYELVTDKEKFLITHSCAFINEIKSRLIPIQDNSVLTDMQ